MTEGGCDGHSSCFGSNYLDGVYRFSLLSVQLFSNLTLMNLHSFSFSGLWHILVNRLNRILAGFLAFLFLLFLAVMFLEIIETWTSHLLGVEKKSEALKFLGIGMGGILLALQALASHTRAKAMEDTANAQAKATEEQAKANQNAEKGQRQERLKNAIEHLGHQSDSVRMGGAYELFHLAQDTEDLRQTVLDILCAHVRQTTRENEYRKKHNKSKPSEEVQSLLTLLFVQKHEVFKGLHINLQGSWLNGAYLGAAYLQGADLKMAHLQGAYLVGTHLQGADLRMAHLQGAYLGTARLQRANLWDTHLQGADLEKARLQGANLRAVHLQGAYLWSAHLQGAMLWGTHLQGAYLEAARLQGVISQQALLPFEEQIRSQIGKESDLSGVIFAGGLSQEELESLVGGLSDEEAKGLREKLIPHVGKRASHRLPKNSGAITGAYSAEEAEEWIAEYKKATSEE